MAGVSRKGIVELSELINRRTKEIDDYLEAQGLPAPTFGVESPADLPLPHSLLEARNEILVASSELQALIAGPVTYLSRLTSPTINIFVSLQAIYRFQVATAFPVGEEISYDELSRRCQVDATDLKRLIRLAITFYIFEEPRKGYIRHTAISKFLAQSPSLHQWIGTVVEEFWPAGPRTVEAMQKWPSSQEPLETGFTLAHGASFWDTMQMSEIRAQRFADGIQYLQTHSLYDYSHLFDGLGWTEETCPALMVDVGGSHGTTAIELLRRFPKLKCVVEDTPEVVATAKTPKDVEGRLRFQPYNFFMPQPIKGADVYFMRSVMHDWSDKYAVRILQNFIPAMKAGAKLVINEVCLPEPHQMPEYHAQLMLGYDIAMKHNFNSRERDANDWHELMRLVHPRLKVNRIVTSPASLLAVIESVWDGELSLESDSLSTDGSSVGDVEEPLTGGDAR